MIFMTFENYEVCAAFVIYTCTVYCSLHHLLIIGDMFLKLQV